VVNSLVTATKGNTTRPNIAQGQPWGKGAKASKPKKWTLGDVASTATTALAIAQGIKALVNVEQKFYEQVAIQQLAAPSNGAGAGFMSGTLLSAVAIGDNANQRDGDSLQLSALEFAGSFSFASSGPAGNARIIIVRDNLGGTQGSAPTINSLLSCVNSGNNDIRLFIPSPVIPNAMVNDRWKVLLDLQVAFPTYASGQEPPKPIAWSRKVKFHQDFITGNNQGRNSIWLFAFSDQTANQPTLTWDWRQWFVDN